MTRLACSGLLILAVGLWPAVAQTPDLANTPSDYRAMLQSQIEKWRPVIERAGIRME